MNSTHITHLRHPVAGIDHRAVSRAPSPLSINSFRISRPNSLTYPDFRLILPSKLSPKTTCNIQIRMLNSYQQFTCSPYRLSSQCSTLIHIRVGAPQVVLVGPPRIYNSSCRLFPWRRASSHYSFRDRFRILMQPLSTQQHQCSQGSSSCRLKCSNLLGQV